MLLATTAIPPGSQAQTQSDEIELRPVIVEPRKIGWKYRHPKLYKLARKSRTVCIFIGPVLNVTANVLTALGEMDLI